MAEGVKLTGASAAPTLTGPSLGYSARFAISKRSVEAQLVFKIEEGDLARSHGNASFRVHLRGAPSEGDPLVDRGPPGADKPPADATCSSILQLGLQLLPAFLNLTKVN